MPLKYLVIADGEGCADTFLAYTDEQVIDFLMEQVGLRDGESEESDRDYWRTDILESKDYWQSRDGYPQWRFETTVGETGHITIQRLSRLSVARAPEDLTPDPVDLPPLI